MAGTRTAPTVDGANTYKTVQLRWMDFTGDKRSDTYVFLAANATNANVETFAAAMQLGSNATLYEVNVSDTYTSTPDSGNAAEVVWENAKTNLVIQATEGVGGRSIRDYVPAPVNTMFLENQNDIDPTAQALIDIIAAFVTLIGGTFEIKGARLTHRRQINQQVKI